MSITTHPQRLAQMMADCHNSIRAAFYYTQQAIDIDLDRPCFLIFVEDAAYEQTTQNQELVDQGYSIAYIGQVFTGIADHLLAVEYEQIAREVADAAVLYILEHPQLQVSDNRSFLGGSLSAANGVLHTSLDGRSAVTLFTRDGVAGDAFWGFTIDITVKQQLAYEAVP